MNQPNRLPPIHALIAFESAARLGGFSQAAVELCITPSAVSHRVRQLESHLGEMLFDRSPTGVRISQAGLNYVGCVREAFDNLAQLKRANKRSNMHLLVGAPPTFARNLLIPRLPDFYLQWPDIEIEIRVVAPMQDKPDQHDVDIRFGSGKFDNRTTSKLFDDVVVALISPDYSQRHAILQPSDIKRTELLRSPLVPWHPWFVSAGLEWPEPTRGLCFTDLGILLEAAASGLGVAVCTRRIASRWIESGNLVELLGVTAPSPRTYFTLVQDDQTQRPEVAIFLEWLGITFS